MPEPATPTTAPDADPATDPTATADLELSLRQTQELLAQAREALSTSERKQQIDRELTLHNAVDTESAAILVHAAIAGTETPDIAAAVADLRLRKPFLFARPPRPSACAMSGEPTPATHSSLDEAESHARQTGDRRSLLRYLQLKRGA